VQHCLVNLRASRRARGIWGDLSLLSIDCFFGFQLYSLSFALAVRPLRRCCFGAPFADEGFFPPAACSFSPFPFSPAHLRIHQVFFFFDSLLSPLPPYSGESRGLADNVRQTGAQLGDDSSGSSNFRRTRAQANEDASGHVFCGNNGAFRNDQGANIGDSSARNWVNTRRPFRVISSESRCSMCWPQLTSTSHLASSINNHPPPAEWVAPASSVGECGQGCHPLIDKYVCGGPVHLDKQPIADSQLFSGE
jgi:hypothetical protein